MSAPKRPGPGWRAGLQAALGDETPPPGTTVLRGRFPRALLHELGRLLLVLSLGATAGALWWLRWRTAGPDALALLAELVTLVFAVRLLVVSVEVARRLRVAASARRWALVLGPEGLLLERPGERLLLPRSALLDARAEGDWARRGGADRWHELLLVLDPAEVPAPPWRRVPPVFPEPPGALAERLMRWRGPLEDTDPEAPPELPSRLYDEAAAGRTCPGCTALPLRLGWLKAAPLASPLMGLALVHLHLARPAGTGEGPPLWLLGALLLTVPAMWVLGAWRRLRPRRGLALLLHPGALMLRLRSGVLAVPWSTVRRCHVTQRPAWSVPLGAHRARTLVVERKDEPALHYEEAWLGAPAEAVASLCEAYRRGRVSRSRARASATRASS